MGRTLRYLGLFVLAATACLLLANLAGWVPDEVSDRWISHGIAIGLACLGAGWLLRVLAPIGREIGRERCVECGAPTELGQRYCRDHLKAVLDQARDLTRARALSGPDPKRSGF